AFLPWSSLSLFLGLTAMVIEHGIPKFRTLGGGLLLVYTGVLLLSSFAAVNTSASIAGWSLYFNWVLLFLLITNVTTTEKRYFIFMLAFFLYCLKMSQHGFRVWVGN